MNRLKIVHINTHDIAGGAARVAWRLAESQRASGHEACMLVGYKNSRSPWVVEFDLDTDPSVLQQCHEDGLLYYEFRGSDRLIHHPWVREADVIHLHNLHGGYFNPGSLILLSQEKPVVWTLHDMQAITGHCAHSFECMRWQTGCGNCPHLETEPALPVDSTARLWQDKQRIYEKSRLRVVSPSLWLENILHSSILRNQPIETIHNGIDTAIFRPYPKDDSRSAFGLPQNAVIAGSVAHGGAMLNQWKGGADLQAVLDRLRPDFPELIFLNIGGNQEGNRPGFINTGHVNDENMLAKLYSCLDVFIYTPLADNCPLVLLEAISCGVPVVAFQVGGVPEIARHGLEGIIIRERDPAAAAAAVLMLLKDRSICSVFSVSGRDRAETAFNHGIVASMYENSYTYAIAAHKRGYVQMSSNSAVIRSVCTPAISIVTPSFNQAQYLEECIDSILSQNYPNLEYIIMDGGSTDGSAEIIRKYEKHLKYWQSQPDNGQYAAIDEGLRMSTGTAMTWLNSDDRLHPGALEMIAELFAEQSEVAWVTGRPNGLDAQGRQSWVLDMLPLWSREKYLNYEYHSPFIQQEGTFWRRELWEKAGGYIRHDLKYAGDLELWTRFFRYAQLFSVDALIAGYRQHPQQKMAGFLGLYHQEAKAVLDFERELFQYAQSRQLRPAPLPIIPKQKDRHDS